MPFSCMYQENILFFRFYHYVRMGGNFLSNIHYLSERFRFKTGQIKNKSSKTNYISLLVTAFNANDQVLINKQTLISKIS